MLIAALLAVAEPTLAPISDKERRAGLEIRDVTASNGQNVRSITTRVPPEQFYTSIPETGDSDFFKDPKVMLQGGWSGYALFELHRREKTTPMVTVSMLHFSKTPESLSKVEVFNEPTPSKGVKFDNRAVSKVPCLDNGACPRANMFQVVVQPGLYRRLLTERRGIPVTFVSSRYGRVTITVPQSAVDGVLEIADPEKAPN